jgi:hypothetical protein
MSVTQIEKAARFRALHDGPGAFVIPNPWDVGSARILAGLGFQALATSSAASASALGRRDGAVVKRMKTYEVRSYIPEKKPKGRRNWAGKQAEQQAVYANRRRVRGEYGKSLLRRRGEFVERSFAHCYETGAMRRCHLRGHENILKRQLIHVGAFNLSLILRTLLGAGTPRELRNRFGRLVVRVLLLFSNRNSQQRLRCSRISGSVAKCVARSRTRLRHPLCRQSATCTTDC